MQLHEHFGVVGRVVALDVVVVDLRIAVAEVREPALDLGHLRELVLDDAQRAIGFRQRGAVRRFHLDQELRRVRLGEQAGADHGHQRRRQQQRAADRGDHRELRARQAPVQRRAVVVMDHAHHAPEELVLVRLACSFSTRLARNGMMNSASSSEPMMVDDHRHRQHADELARRARQRQQRQEGEDQRRRAAEDGDEDLLRAGERGLDARIPHAHVPRDVFHDHDGIVDQQAERHDEARDRQLVERIAEEIQAREAERQRQRDRDHHDARGAQPERQQRQQHQRDRDAEVEVQPVEARAHVLRLVEADLELHALRQVGGELVGRGHHALAHVEDVVAVLLVRGDEHRALAVEAAGVAVRGGVPADLRHVAHAHDAAVDGGDDRVAHLVERGVAAGGLEAEAARAEIDEARGNVRVLALHRADQLRGREVELGHALEVDARRAARARGRPSSPRCARRRPSSACP